MRKWFNFKKKDRIPYQVWEVRNPILPKPKFPIKLIKKIHKIKQNLPERFNFFIKLSRF
jgi:hypothetical protein